MHVREAKRYLEQARASSSSGVDDSYQATTLQSTSGRPRFCVTYEQLQYFLGHGFTVPIIAKMLGVSVRTVRRRMTDFGLSSRARFSDVSDSDLDAVVKKLKKQYPHCGYRILTDFSRPRGFLSKKFELEKLYSGVILKVLQLVGYVFLIQDALTPSLAPWRCGILMEIIN